MEPRSFSPGLRNFIRNVTRWRPQPGLLAITLMLALGSLMTAVYLSTQAEVTLVLNGLVWHLRTHQTSVEAFLDEAGIQVHPEDIVSPSLATPIQAGGTILAWTDGALSYVLIGNTEMSRLMEIAELISATNRREEG